MFKFQSLVFAFWLLLLIIVFLRRKNLQSSKKYGESGYAFSFFLIVTFTGLLLRVINLNLNSYWLEELMSVMISSKDSVSDVIQGCISDFHPPLYQIILHYYIKLFGDSELSTRFLSVIFGTLSIFVFYFILELIYGEKKATEISLLFSVAYLPVYYSQETRSYSLLLLLALLVNYYFLKTFILNKNNNLDRKWKYSLHPVYIIFSLMLLFTHYYGFLILLLNVIFLIFYLIITSNSKKLVNEILKSIAIYAGIFFIYWLIWGNVLRAQYGKEFWPLMPVGFFSSFKSYVLNPNLRSDFIGDAILCLFEILIFLNMIYLLIILIKEKLEKKITDTERIFSFFLCLWAVLPFAFGYFQSVYSKPSLSFRNLIISAPAVIALFYLYSFKSINVFLLILDKKVVSLKRVSSKMIRLFQEYSFVSALTISLVLFMKLYNYYAYPAKQDIRGLTKSIIDESEIFYKDPIIFSSVNAVSRLNYYFEKTNSELRIRAYLDEDHFEQTLANYKTEIEKHKFIILVFVSSWKNQETVLNYFKGNFSLILQRDYNGVGYFVFSAK